MQLTMTTTTMTTEIILPKQLSGENLLGICQVWIDGFSVFPGEAGRDHMGSDWYGMVYIAQLCVFNTLTNVTQRSPFRYLSPRDGKVAETIVKDNVIRLNWDKLNVPTSNCHTTFLKIFFTFPCCRDGAVNRSNNAPNNNDTAAVRFRGQTRYNTNANAKKRASFVQGWLVWTTN